MQRGCGLGPPIHAVVALASVGWLLGGGAWAAEWVRAGVNTNAPAWGVRGGLLWAIPPGGGGPRGLIRLYSPINTNGGYALVNFIAVEPIVNGRRGFSELESSQLDATSGKRFWALGETSAGVGDLPARGVAGRLSKVAPGVEQLDVAVGVEPFDNGAHVRLVVAQRSDAPDELRVSVFRESDSAPLEFCILTATMGNQARTRLLWLKDETVSSLKHFAGHTGDGFTEHARFSLARLRRTETGDALVAITTDEENPATVFPFPGTRRWYYGGRKVTQYWRKPAEGMGEDLQAVVNARFTYWMSQRPIPGGVAYENFELQERFRNGQTFVFGITTRTPAELGWGGGTAAKSGGRGSTATR